MNAKFLVALRDVAPAMMCEHHARAFEALMIEHEEPHTIYELEEDDGPYKCHACDLQEAREDLERPKIILPN